MPIVPAPGALCSNFVKSKPLGELCTRFRRYAVHALVMAQDLYEVCYRDDSFLLVAGPLNRANLLYGGHSRHNPVQPRYYFAGSQFYDRSCNNERVKDEALDPSLLRNMVGVEYELGLTTCDSRLFVVIKQRRQTQLIADKIALCYVLDGNIYQAPSLLAVFHSRLIKCVHHLHKAFARLGNAPSPVVALRPHPVFLDQAIAVGRHKGRIQSCMGDTSISAFPS